MVRYECAEENQATPKVAFGFLAHSTSKGAAKQTTEHEVWLCEFVTSRRKPSDTEGGTMDFRFFQKLFEHATFDEIKVIGKDILIEEHSGHIIGMTRKDKQVRLYILEQCESVEDIESCAECEDEAHEIPQAEKHQTGVQKVSFRGRTWSVPAGSR